MQERRGGEEAKAPYQQRGLFRVRHGPAPRNMPMDGAAPAKNQKEKTSRAITIREGNFGDDDDDGRGEKSATRGRADFGWFCSLASNRAPVGARISSMVG